MNYLDQLHLWANQHGDKVIRFSGWRGLELCLENNRGQHTDGNRLSARDFMPESEPVKPPYVNILFRNPPQLPDLETQAKHLLRFLETGELVRFEENMK